MRLSKGLSLAFGVVLVSGFALGQSRFADDATVVVVEVPVNVIRDGAPVRGLTADDFEIVDGRKKQEVTDFDVIDLSEVGSGDRRGAEIPTIAISGRRNILLLFDLSYSDLQSLDRVRSAAREIVATSLHPSDLVGVGTYSKAAGTRLVLGFTGNRDQADAAIGNLGLTAWREGIADPLGLLVEADVSIWSEGERVGQEAGASQGGQIDRDALFAEQAADLRIGEDRARLDREKNSFLGVTTTFAKLAELIANAEGRKHVILLSEGFNSELLTGVDDMERQIEINRASEFGQTQRINSNERFGDSDASSSLRQMVTAFRRADCTIQAVNIAGLDAGAKIARNEAMFRMANETGGELLQNFNNIGTAMRAVLDHTSVTYVLAFEPSDLEFDGRFHPLKVKLKKAPRGTKILHRSGYFPPKAFDQMQPLERRLATASDVLGGGEGGVLPMAILAAPFYAEDGDSYVPVLIEIDGAALVASEQGDTMMTEIFAYAFDDRGAVRDFFVRRLGLDVKGSKEALLKSGFKYWGHLDLEPGDYLLRVLVRNGRTGDSGLATAPLRVPNFEARESVLFPALFPEPMGKWVMGREDEAEQRQGVSFPFVLGAEPFVPAAQPGLGDGSRRISLVGYNLGEGEISVSAKLLDAHGDEVEALSLEVIGHTRGAGGLQRLEAELEAGALTAGDYTLVTTVYDLAGGTEQQSSAQVTVG